MLTLKVIQFSLVCYTIQQTILYNKLYNTFIRYKTLVTYEPHTIMLLKSVDIQGYSREGYFGISFRRNLLYTLQQYLDFKF
jgi:hypothetical protein